jgi:hypothetical protein
MTMINHFDLAREIARCVDAGKSGDETVAEMHRLFPMATAADYARARDIGLDRVQMLEEERHEAARQLAAKWFSGPAPEVVEEGIRLYQSKMLPSAATLFPKPDKSKS